MYATYSATYLITVTTYVLRMKETLQTDYFKKHKLDCLWKIKEK